MNKRFRIAFLVMTVFCIFLMNAEMTKNWARKNVKGNECLVYDVNKGESLYGIAKKYGWDIKLLQEYNPEMNSELKKGDKLYYPILADVYLRHEVKKGETIYSIANYYGIPVDTLYKNNPTAQRGIKKGEILLLKNDKVNYHNSDTTDYNINYFTEEKEILIENINENLKNEVDNPIVLKENLDDENDEITTVEDEILTFEETPRIEEVRLAVILDDPKSKKDIEFSRGMLVALNQMKNAPYKISLKVIDGKSETVDILLDLEDYNPNLIFTTADRSFPSYLLDYTLDHDVEIINIFYLKDNKAKSNDKIIQMLLPSVYFNKMIASSLFKDKDNEDRTLVLVGAEDSKDDLSAELNRMFGKGIFLSNDEFSSYYSNSASVDNVLVYSLAQKKDEIVDFFIYMEEISGNNPEFDYILLGRPSWMLFKDELKELFEKYNVILPSRVWLDTTTPTWSNFINHYETMFATTPVRSIPNFAASGYDMVTYFIPEVYDLDGDYSNGFKSSTGRLLQSDVQLYKETNNSGYLNGVGYLIKFSPEGETKETFIGLGDSKSQ